jgi:hypothetical protein
MKPTRILIAMFACVLSTALPAFSQEPGTAAPPPAPNWFNGTASIVLLGREAVDSSKFEEYRAVPEGASIPVFTVQGSHDGRDFGIFGENVSRSDQRYSGHANVGWLGVTFDYKQIPHNMGNSGQTVFTETSPGVWNMSSTVRTSLANAVDAVPASARNYAFYSNLLGPTLPRTVDVSGLRKRGDVVLDLAGNAPFDLTFTYMRDAKSGTRGASGGDILGVVTSAVDVLEPLNEVTQDFGLRWAYNVRAGNVYATFNRNVFNNRQESLVIDNPFRPTDLAYVSTAVPGGPAQVRFGTEPDNEASRGAFGGGLKFKRQTRITADVAFGTWTQNADFLPFTINSAILTSTGAPANSTAALPQQSLDGKINTTTVNVAFASRPVDAMGVRLRYRSYDLTNKTTPINWTGGSTSGSPDRSWGAEAATEEAPYGYLTANLYDSSSQRFDAQVGYDIKDVTLEAAFRTAKLERTSREATSGNDNGYALSAVYSAREWARMRVVYDWLHRTAKGWNPATSIGLQSDESERETTRTGVDIDVTPWTRFGLNLAYFRRNDEFPDRPSRVAGNPETTVGLLGAKYDTYTVGFDFTPNERATLNAYYTYEKNAQTNRFVTLTSGNLNNQLRYDGSDKGNTFGVSGLFQIVPDKWVFSLMMQHQKVDGFMDITAREAGSFYTPGRTTLVAPGTGGALDINDFDDTEWTTAVLDLAYTFATAWTFSVGYGYDKYTHADAFSDGTTIFPQSVLFFMKADNGGYTANVGYAKLSWRF